VERRRLYGGEEGRSTWSAGAQGELLRKISVEGYQIPRGKASKGSKAGRSYITEGKTPKTHYDCKIEGGKVKQLGLDRAV